MVNWNRKEIIKIYEKNQAIRAITEAEIHKGPSSVICYCPCIEHVIKNGMCNSIKEEKLAVECGYVLLMRYLESTLYIDSPEPNFEKYSDFLSNEVRYNALKLKDEKLAKKLLEDQKQNAIQTAYFMFRIQRRKFVLKS